MGKIMGKLKHNYSAFPQLRTTFFIKNVSFGHFHQVSMNFITISRFLKFQVNNMTSFKKIFRSNMTSNFQVQHDVF